MEIETNKSNSVFRVCGRKYILKKNISKIKEHGHEKIDSLEFAGDNSNM